MSDSNENEEYEDNDEDYEHFDMYFSKEALLEFNVNNSGINIIGNAQGYLALARFCTYLAEHYHEASLDPEEFKELKEAYTGYTDYHLGLYIGDKAIREKRYMFSRGPLKKYQLKDEYAYQDVHFGIASQIGPKFWKDCAESGSDQEWIETYVSSEESSNTQDITT